ncbi:MAG: ABC transporter permease [Ignavibacteriales bacterium]|nr:ABC transporter permease [Ignavibacteriales bacterium]
MIFKLAWRNIWRNKRRSVVVMTSVAVGVIATLLMDTLSRGMIYQMLYNQIGSHVAHLQIHRQGFRDNPIIQNNIPDAAVVERAVSSTPGISHYSSRILTYGLLSSAAASSGVFLIGIDPDQEGQITTIKGSLAAGTYLSGGPNEAVIGQSLAEKLGVGLGDRVVGMASALDGHVGSDVFRIVGLYETLSSEFDKSFIYIARDNAQEMLGVGDLVSEFAIRINDISQLHTIQDRLLEELGEEYEVFTYPEILPFLVLQIDLYEQSMIIFYAIIGIALIFGIINTMLMSVFERIREFGVLKAVGMKDRRLLMMIVLEAFLLGIIGTGIGFIVGYLIYLPLARTGLDLSMFSESLRSWGVGAIIYPVLTWNVIANALLIIPIFAVLGALYPAFRAGRLQPMAAIRYV